MNYKLQIINYRLRTKIHIREKTIDLRKEIESKLLSVFDEYKHLTLKDQVFLISSMIKKEKFIPSKVLDWLNTYRKEAVEKIIQNKYSYLEDAKYVLFLMESGYNKKHPEDFVAYCYQEMSNQDKNAIKKFHSLEKGSSIRNAARGTTNKLFEEYEINLNLNEEDLLKNLGLLKIKLTHSPNRDVKQLLRYQENGSKKILTCQMIDLIDIKIQQELPELNAEVMKQVMHPRLKKQKYKLLKKPVKLF